MSTPALVPVVAGKAASFRCEAHYHGMGRQTKLPDFAFALPAGAHMAAHGTLRCSRSGAPPGLRSVSATCPKPAPVAAWLFLLLSGAQFASAQLFSYGAKAGVPLTNFLGTPASSYTGSINRYAIGGTVEARLPWNLAIEVDGIYRHYGYSGGPWLADKTSTGDWEFPILAKYRFAKGAVRPYADAGFAIDTLSGTSQTESFAIPLTRLLHHTR